MNPVQVEDVWLFVEHGDYNYRKLDDEAPISAELSNNDIVHIVSDRFFEQRDMIAVYSDNKFDEVGFERKHSNGNYQSETLLSLKLRVQEQFGFPVPSSTVFVSGAQVPDDDHMVETPADDIWVLVSVWDDEPEL